MATTNGMKALELEAEPLQSNGDESSPQPQPVHPMIFMVNGWRLLCAYVDHYRVVTLPVGAFLLILAVIFGLEAIAHHSTKSHVAVIEHDYTDAHSVFELKMNQIDHWCLSVSRKIARTCVHVCMCHYCTRSTDVILTLYISFF